MTSRLLALCALMSTCGYARADVALLGVGTIPGTASDRSGLGGKASDGTPHDRLGGLGSAIAYGGRGTEYVLVSDRGPKDGASDFACRYHRMDIRVTPGATEPVSLKLVATTLLTDAAGRRYVGSLDAFRDTDPTRNLRLDPEGVRVGRGGELYVSDEYGPVIYEFDPSGRRRRSLAVPSHFRAPRPGKSPADELPPHATTGRQPNRGMEGLAISSDRKRLVGIMQGPLLQDGGLNEKNERVGVNVRILDVELASGKTREFVYQLSDPANGVSEIVAVSDHQYLVLERDGRAGKEALFKRVFLIDLTGATDVSGVAALPRGALPAGVKAAAKAPFLDLLDPRFGIAGAGCPEKFEGLAFGPDLPDGRRLLLITADNDFVAEQPLRVYAFAVGRSDLPGLTPS
ncbi:MAG: esterase-like activity of phytase family protein [Gemmataceae bacterium]